MAQNDLMMRLGLLLGDRSSGSADGYPDFDQPASAIMERPVSAGKMRATVSTRYNPDRAGSMPDRYTGGGDWSANTAAGKFTSHERSSSTPERNTYQSTEDMYTTVSSLGTSDGTPDRGISDNSPISTLTGKAMPIYGKNP